MLLVGSGEGVGVAGGALGDEGGRCWWGVGGGRWCCCPHCPNADMCILILYSIKVI